MSRFLILFCLLLVWAPSAAEQSAERGEIYATVELRPNGDIDVIDLRSDLPQRLDPEIESWLKEQAIGLAADPAAEDTNRTTVQIEYSIVDDGQGGRGLALVVKGTGASAPPGPESPADLALMEVPVEVRLRADGSVADVTTLAELPEGVSANDVEAAVRADIESDPEIQAAAGDGRLEDDVHRLTVRLREAKQ